MFNGSIGAFQAQGGGSSPLSRSKHVTSLENEMIKQLFALPMFVAGMIVTISTAQANQYDLTEQEHELIETAYEHGKESQMGLALVALLEQESHFGRYGPVGDTHLPVGDRSYGLYQIRVGAARQAISVCPELAQGQTLFVEQIISKLITDDQWSMDVARCYLQYALKNSDGDILQALSKYNGGHMYTTHQTSFVEREYVQEVVNNGERLASEFQFDDVQDDLLYQAIDRSKETTVVTSDGDTLYELVQEHTNLSTDSEITDKIDWIVENNPHAFSQKGDPSTLKSGVELLIDQSELDQPTNNQIEASVENKDQSDSDTYTVQKGDTLYSIVKEHTDLTEHDEIMDYVDKVVEQNQQHFENNDPATLKNNVQLRLP